MFVAFKRSNMKQKLVIFSGADTQIATQGGSRFLTSSIPSGGGYSTGNPIMPIRSSQNLKTSMT